MWAKVVFDPHVFAGMFLGGRQRHPVAMVAGVKMSIKVAINGFGTMGETSRRRSRCQDDMEIVGVTKTGPPFGCDLA
ncbi:MAG: hypothetical protein Ct9H90mP16_01760 [Candidatus Poseidoniales archaeon]|nr:MAG: hypothetical protein Ct9H90mP16_01760 [Candidatus Poseidoniales archaeon]